MSKRCRSCGVPEGSIGLSCNGRMGHDFDTGPTVKFKRLHKDAVIPKYQTNGAAGMDLHWDGYYYAHSEGAVEGRQVNGGLRVAEYPAVFGTGLLVEVPEGYEAQIRPRSSLSKSGILCHLGTLDSDYRGQILVCLQFITGSGQPYGRHVYVGDRIAQLVIAPVAQATIVEVEELSETARGTGGFGSTGR